MKLLSNAPLGKDLFEGKSQELIADAIVKQLERNANQRDPDLHHQMIGIEGSWGSGKSNLVEIVKKKLDEKYESKKFHFFTYDVWGHQEDLQRKAILEELVNDLVENKVIVNSTEEKHDRNWKERVKNITGTFTETTRRQIPSISLGFALCVLALIISPVCGNISDGSIGANIAPWIPSAIVLLALLIFVIRKGFKRGFAEFIYSYKGKSIESTEREFIHEKNPSVLDFRILLHDISKVLIGKHLIIFFDNMDRLPKQKVERLWSSIHTFFAENHDYNNISYIVTFDRKHIQDAFSVKNDNSRGNDYIDKTFDIVFRVAAPVLVDWKKFFEKKWKEAFENEFNPIEYEYVIQAYDILSDSSNPIPRSIIRFINECVLLKRTFRDIPERYIAIFNLKKDDLLNRPLDMKCLNNNLQSIYEHDPKYYDYITALVYQVPPENAISVIYKQALYKALEQHNQKELIDISQAPFFKDILEDALNYFALLKDPIVSLDELGDIPLPDERQKKLWRDLYFRTVQSMQFDSGKIEPYQIVLLKHLEKEQRTELIQKILSPFNSIDFTIHDIYGEHGKEYTPEEYVELLKNMEKAIQRDELKGFLQKIPIKTDTHKNLLQKIEDIDWIPFECK
ncbi:P-loop NTPase fold protein [Fibrobacter sp. UBA2449]|uniref:P-loop NTPase fold protein n=1 Tax=Fibrobacter sp. UBA2449 TaxID=1946529 RepID=UPI0025C43C5E|nr:P-loop NTPase fold protein [Fibrobacter sp. UBA2449]